MMYAMCAHWPRSRKTKSSREDLSRRDSSEVVHRCDETFQSRVTVRVPVLHGVCRSVNHISYCGFV